MHRYFIIIGFVIPAMLGCNAGPTGGGKPEAGQDTVTDQVEKKTPDQQNYLILDRSAGKFKIGQPIPFPSSSDSYKVIRESQVRMTEEGPYEETVYVVREGNEDLLNIIPRYNYETETYTDTIGEIIVLSPKYRTPNGIGVNSTITEFIHQYPDYHIWYTYVSGMYVIESNDLKAQFILKEKDFTGTLNVTSEITPLEKSDFKADAKILKVRLL